MLVTARECNQVGRNSCTSAIASSGVEHATSSALSTLELRAAALTLEHRRVESPAAGDDASGGGGGGGVGSLAIRSVGATAPVNRSITPPAWPVPNRSCASAAP